MENEVQSAWVWGHVSNLTSSIALLANGSRTGGSKHVKFIDPSCWILLLRGAL